MTTNWLNSPERKQYFAERDALVHTKIGSADDIAKLPWHGNHASDHGLFMACEKFVRAATDREEQKRALWATANYGMGIDEPVSDEDLDHYLACRD